MYEGYYEEKATEPNRGGINVSARPVRSGTNRIIDQRLAMKKQNIHLKKLRSAKSTIDTKPPASMKLMSRRKLNLKKEYLKKMRNKEIQKQNNILIHKILDLDCRNEKIRVDTYRSAPVNKSVSLNKYSKKQELQRITKDNKRILHRIINVNSEFSADKWKKSDRERGRILHNLQMNSQNYFGRDQVSSRRDYDGDIDLNYNRREAYRSPTKGTNYAPTRPHSSSIGIRPKSASSTQVKRRPRPNSAMPIMSSNATTSRGRAYGEGYERNTDDEIREDRDIGADNTRLEFIEENERMTLERGVSRMGRSRTSNSHYYESDEEEGREYYENA